MKTLSNMGFALFGAALVAISYGLARFAFGLFVPSISTELSITPAMIGVIGGVALCELCAGHADGAQGGRLVRCPVSGHALRNAGRGWPGGH